MTAINPFLYRLPRFGANFPVDFLLGDLLTPGFCLNLSNTGLLGQFTYPLGVSATGTLRLRPANRLFELRAQVTHTEGLRSGLHFDFASGQEQQVIVALVAILSGRAVDPL